MFITFRDALTQTFVFNIDALQKVHQMTQQGYNYIDMQVTESQVYFKFNNDRKGCHLYKTYRFNNMGDIRKAIHAPDWIKPLVMARVPFGRMYVRFDEELKMFIYENIDKQFPMEVEAVNEQIRGKKHVILGVGTDTIGIADAIRGSEKIQASSTYGEMGSVPLYGADKNGNVRTGSKRTINRAMRRKLAKKKRLQEKRESRGNK